jgi:hypothetical protein
VGFVDGIWSSLHPGVRVERLTAEVAGQVTGWWPSHPIGAAAVDGLTRLAAWLVRLALLPIWSAELSLAAEARGRLEAALGGLPWPTRPLRIGLHMPESEAGALSEARGTCRVEWLRLASWEDPQAACRRHALDAVVYHAADGPVRIVTLERPGRAAGIVEWADPRAPLTFDSVFPSRIDPAAVVIEGATRTRVREGADLLRGLLEAAALLARSAHRLTLADTMLGRRATDPSTEGSPRSSSATFQALADSAHRQRECWPEASALARRVVGAYFISVSGLEPRERSAGLERAAGDSPDALAALRLGASCIGALDDEHGVDWLVKADALMREGVANLAPLDHAAFLEAELAHGTDDPMGVGRAAAGIAMVCAAATCERIAFVRDDMLEEMAYAGWLVGRDQDRGLLIGVFLEIEHARRGVPDEAPVRRDRLRAWARRGLSAAA